MRIVERSVPTKVAPLLIHAALQAIGESGESNKTVRIGPGHYSTPEELWEYVPHHTEGHNALGYLAFDAAPYLKVARRVAEAGMKGYDVPPRIWEKFREDQRKNKQGLSIAGFHEDRIKTILEQLFFAPQISRITRQAPHPQNEIADAIAYRFKYSTIGFVPEAYVLDSILKAQADLMVEYLLGERL